MLLLLFFDIFPAGWAKPRLVGLSPDSGAPPHQKIVLLLWGGRVPLPSAAQAQLLLRGGGYTFFPFCWKEWSGYPSIGWYMSSINWLMPWIKFLMPSINRNLSLIIRRMPLMTEQCNSAADSCYQFLEIPWSVSREMLWITSNFNGLMD